MKNILLFLGLLWGGHGTVSAQTTLINQNFEAAVGATLANNATNAWVRGTAAAQAGSFGLYISNNGGTSNAYTITTTQVSHAYWTVNFPAGETNITLSFNWRGVGEGCCDYLRIYTQTTNPTAGTLPTGTLHATYNGQSTWQTVNLTLPGTLAGQNNVRVIFTWRNDASVGSQPPAAIDNVVLTSAPPPLGATCSNPIVVGSYPYTNTNTTCGSINDYGTQCATSYGNGEDLVYQLNISTTGVYNFSLTGTGGWSGMFLKSAANCTNAASCLAFDATSGTSQAFTYNFTAAGTYYLIIDTWPAPTCTGFTLNITAPSPPPANDNCAGAISLTPGPTCSYTAGTSAGASQTFAGCSGTADDDVWYSFVATSTAHQINVQGAASFDAVVQVYGTSCGGTSLACVNATGAGVLESAVVTGLTVGATYWVRTYHAGVGSSATPTFNICVTVPPPGATCGNPIVVSSYPYTNTNTTCGSINDYGTQCATSYGNGEDLVYQLNISTTGVYNFSLTGTGGWSGMFLKSAANCTNAASCLAFDATSGTSQAFTYNFTAAGTYYLIIDTWPAPTCTGFTLNITAPSPPPANDNCAGAISLTPGPTCSYTAGTSAGASQTFAGCSGTADDDVWYSFVATSTAHQINVQGAASFDAVIQVYGGSCGGTSLVCTNATGVGALESAIVTGLTVGATYWVRTYHAGVGSSATPTFNICVTVPPPGATCGNPIVVNSYPYTHSSSTVGLGNDIGIQTSTCSSFYGNGEDVVYQLNISTPGNYVIDLVNDSGTGWIGWFLKSSANCTNTGSSLACAVSGGANVANGTYNFTTAGTYFLIVDYWPAPNNSNYTLNIYLAPPPPANDNCAGSILLTSGMGCSYTAGTSSFATQTFAGCSGTADDDVWYHFVATHTTHIVQVQGGTSYDAVIQVYGGSCGGTSLTCTNVNGIGLMETVSISGLTVGATYWVRVYHAGTGSSTTPTFNICVTDPPPGDNCSSPVVVNTYPYSISSTTLGLVNDYGTQACNTSYGGGNDAVFQLNISTPGPYLIDLTNTSGTGWIGWFLATTCGNTGPSLACQVSGGGNNAASVFNFSAAGTYYLIIDYWPSPTNSNYTLNIIPLVCPSGLGPTVNVAALPYSSSGRTTCGQGNELTPLSAVTCGSNLYFTDMDEVFVFTPTTSGMITVNLTTTSINTGLALYQGCPFSGTCVGNSQSASASKTMCATVAAGQTYYLIVDSYLTGGGCIGSYSISITAPGASPSCVSGLGTGVVNIPALPYSVTGHSTCGMANDLTSSNTLVCGSSSYYTAEDRVYVFTPTTTGMSTITLTSSSSWVGLMLYAGCPLSDACYGGGGTCVANEQSSSGNQTMQVCLQAGQTYYLLVDQWAGPTCIPSYNLSITAPVSGVGALNDLPCAALELPMGIFVGGTNACATGVSEPGVPGCWSGGTLNTVWYRFVAPSTSVKLRTILYSLTNTQIAVYSAPSCSGPFTQIGCNQNAPDCGFTSVLNSELTVTGLTAGTTYYVRVDGVNDLKGNFSIVAIDGSASFPPVNGQDCPSPVPVCSPVTAIGDPGYQAIGSTCDHTGTSNCTTGERGAAWYQININNAGALNFTIRPNDGVTDYDFVLWKIAGAGATNCATIASSGGAGAVSCNYSYLGTTGVYTGGNTPPPYSGYDDAFEPTVNVAAGEVYLLAVQNFSNSTSGFSLDFSHSGAGVVNYTAPTTVYWTGTASTAWNNPLNWGGCSVPDCSKNAVILPGAANQPVIDGSITVAVRDLTISPGATLTITAGSELQICGHYTNTGYLTADPGSTVRMMGSLTPQNMTGYMTTFSKFDNLIIDKTNAGDNVFLYADCETAGNFTVAKGNFRLNGNDHFAGGNFTVNAGGGYIPGTGSTHFNGAGTQTFTNNGMCVFNHVNMVKSAASGVTLNHNMVLNGTTAILTLTNGWITTGINRVIVNNPAVTAVTPGNSNSYVRGNLRRFVNTTGAYDLPVGNATLGYQRININFTTAHGGGAGGGYHYLDASFSDGAPGGAVIGQHECGNNGYDAWLYNGYWTVNGGRTDAGAITVPGEYTAIGYPTGYAPVYNTYNYANITGNASATLAKGSVFTSLALEGSCMYNSSPSTGIGRIGLSGFSDFSPAIDINTPFPVEMTPLKAEAMPGTIRLSWETASETNNRGFEIERGTNENEFVKIGWQDGAGNSSSLKAYTYDDRDVQAGVKYYYRLRQVDFDGRAGYSNVAAAQLLDDIKDLGLSVYPNPTDGAFVLSVVSPSERKLTIEVYDMVGRRVAQTTTLAPAGKSEAPLSLSGAAAGAYQLKVIDGEKTHVLRIQKK